MKVLVIAAHPDDEVLGMGGTIARHAKLLGDTVRTLIVTDGSSSQYPDRPDIIRKKYEEAQRASDILGVEKHIHHDLPDMKLDTIAHTEINRVVEQNIAEFQPQIVYCVHPDVNKDHQCLYESTCVALRPVPGMTVRKFLTYAPLSSTEWTPPVGFAPFEPNVFVDISETIDAKIAAFREYKTELRESPHPRSIEGIKAFAAREGMRVGCAYAEPFCLIREIQGTKER